MADVVSSQRSQVVRGMDGAGGNEGVRLKAGEEVVTLVVGGWGEMGARLERPTQWISGEIMRIDSWAES